MSDGMAHTTLGTLRQLRGAESRRNRQVPEQMPNILPAVGFRIRWNRDRH